MHSEQQETTNDTSTEIDPLVKIRSLFSELYQDYDEFQKLKEQKLVQDKQMAQRKEMACQTSYPEEEDPEKLKEQMENYRVELQQLYLLSESIKEEHVRLKEMALQKNALVSDMTQRQDELIQEKSKIENDFRQVYQAYEETKKWNEVLKEENQRLTIVQEEYEKLKTEQSLKNQAYENFENERDCLKEALENQEMLMKHVVVQLAQERKKNEGYSRLSPCLQQFVKDMHEIMPVVGTPSHRDGSSTNSISRHDSTNESRNRKRSYNSNERDYTRKYRRY